MKKLIPLIFIMVFSVATYGFVMPVIDITAEESRWVIFGKEVAQWAKEAGQWKAQYDAFAQYANKFEVFRAFNEKSRALESSVVEAPSDEIARATNGRIDIRAIGWGGEDVFFQHASTRPLVTSIRDLREIWDARGDASQMSRIRDHIEEIYGDPAVTRPAASVALAQREMGAATIAINDTAIAIDEKRRNIEQIKEEIGAGDLVPGDIERKMALIAAEQVDIEALSVKAQNQTNRLSVNQLGLTSTLVNAPEVSRLQERQRRLALMSSTYFSPAGPGEAGGMGVE